MPAIALGLIIFSGLPISPPRLCAYAAGADIR